MSDVKDFESEQGQRRDQARDGDDRSVQDRLRQRREAAADRPRVRGAEREDRGVERPRTGARRNVMRALSQLPAYLRLLVGLISDRRVSKMDRLFVVAAVAYILSPIDFIPDVIPFLGEVDDVFLLMIALQRLVDNAGRAVLLSHWAGDPDEVHHLSFARIISAAGFFLPSQIKRRLFKMARVGRRRKK